MRRFALVLAGTGSEADALVREACARAIQKSHHWKGEGRLESWLFSMIRNLWTDEAKKQKARSEPSHAGVPDGRKLEGKSAAMLAAIPDGLTASFLLVDVEGFSYAEAADILGIPVRLLTSRLSAARLSLAAIGMAAAERRA
jgi:RNA polymerase sigma-70 factor (ECF subfamily)